MLNNRRKENITQSVANETSRDLHDQQFKCISVGRRGRYKIVINCTGKYESTRLKKFYKSVYQLIWRRISRKPLND